MQKTERSKKGAGHVEMIFSFIIFISFLIFVFAFINPVKKTEPSRALLDIAEQEVIKNASINITTISFMLNYTPGTPCFSINLLELEINEIIGNSNLIIRNSTDDIIGMKKINSDLYIEKAGDFYKIFASDDFNAISYAAADCEAIKKENITIGQVTATKAISFKRIEKLNHTYTDDYDSLKQSINFPSGNDFGFIAKDNSRNIIIGAIKERPQSAVVIAKEQPVELVYENSTSIVAVLNIQAW